MNKLAKRLWFTLWTFIWFTPAVVLITLGSIWLDGEADDEEWVNAWQAFWRGL